MALPSLVVNITGGNLGRQAPDADNIAAIVTNNYPAIAGIADKSRNVLYSIKQAESLGITADYDDTEEVLLHHHIAEFFRMNTSGELHLITLFDASTPYTVQQVFGNNTTPSLLEPILVAANGRIKQIGYLDPGAEYSTLSTTVALAQGLADRLLDQLLQVDAIFIGALEFDEAVGSLTDLRTFDARNLGVVVGGDFGTASLMAAYEGYTSVGTLLGSSTNKEVHESFAWAKDENTITSVADNAFLDVKYALSFATADPFKNDKAAQAELHDKGYIFPRQYPLRSGYFWNQSSNCVPIDSDINSLELVQVVNKAIRLISGVLSLKINQNFDIEDGRLTETERKIIEAEVRKVLDINLSDNISSLGTLEIDPVNDDNNQPYPSLLADATLRARVGLVPKGKAEQILLFIGYQAG